jgi:hypothetical protein
VAVSKSGKVTTVSITDKNGTKTATINDGSDGSNGKDGTSVTVKSVSESTADGGSNVVTFSDGKTLTVKNGKQGTPGKNPVKGTDYWTTADQEEIVQQVITALGTPVFGRVDADNNIILTGNLADGLYTVKYEDAIGNTTNIGSIIVAPEIVNMIPLSINADGSQFVGTNGEDGYKTGFRLNSSGAEASAPVFSVTGFIPVKYGDVVRFKNISYAPGVEDDSGNYLVVYKSDFTHITSVKSSALTETHYVFKPVTTDDSTGYITSVTMADPTLGYAYLRISAKTLNADSIITVNQEIP